jgi:hypothetical protein
MIRRVIHTHIGMSMKVNLYPPLGCAYQADPRHDPFNSTMVRPGTTEVGPMPTRHEGRAMLGPLLQPVAVVSARPDTIIFFTFRLIIYIYLEYKFTI